MAKSSAYQWLDLAKPTIPYRSYTSPVDEQPHFIPGAQNILGTEIGYLEKRPGFSTPIESVLSTVPGTIVRISSWRRWAGSFFTMLCTIDGGVAKVYKLENGVDASFSLIWTSTSPTPFDFVVSNNFCFFGNATDMKKFNGTTVSKWGCADSGFAPTFALQSGNLPPGMSYNGATNTLSGTPTVQGTSQITIDVTDAVGGKTSKTFNFTVNPAILAITTPSNLQFSGVGSPVTYTFAANYGSPAYTFSVFSGTVPPGLTLTGANLSGTPTTPGQYNFAIKVTDSLGHIAVKPFSAYVVTATGPSIAATGPSVGTVGSPFGPFVVTASGVTAPYTFTYLNGTGAIAPPFNTLPPGLTFTTATPTVTIAGTPTSPGTYVIDLLVTDSTGLTAIHSYSFTISPASLQVITRTLQGSIQGFAYSQALIIDGGSSPYTSTFTAGSLNAQSGYVYGYTYTTVYGHESNMSPLSVNTGLFTNLDVNVTVIASADSQVNGINIYRTTDGGVADPAIMRLVVNLANTTQTYQDATQDVNLGLQTGPGFLINTPPTPCLGFVWSNGRIYGSTNNMQFYSGAEEVSNGIAEEAWPSGLDGNFYAWPSEVGGTAVTANGVDTGLSEQFWQVSGDTLDTFRKSLLLDKAGVRSPTCINSVGDSVQWIDTAKQAWSSSLGEFGEPIRPDLSATNPLQTYIGYHKSKLYNWIYILDTLNSKLFVYDLDLDQWNTPWTVAATAICSGETSLGKLSLLAAFGGHVMVLTPGTYVDNGVAYEDDFKIGLLPISPGRLTSGRSKIEPTQIEDVQFEMNAVNYASQLPSFVGQLSDDDPTQALKIEWTDLTGNFALPQFIKPGKYLNQLRYVGDSTTDPAIRTAFWIQWAPSAIGWRMYSFTVDWIKS